MTSPTGRTPEVPPFQSPRIVEARYRQAVTRSRNHLLDAESIVAHDGASFAELEARIIDRLSRAIDAYARSGSRAQAVAAWRALYGGRA